MIVFGFFLACNEPSEKKIVHGHGEEFISCWPETNELPIPPEERRPKIEDFLLLDQRAKRLIVYQKNKLLISGNQLFCFHYDSNIKITQGWGIIGKHNGSLQIQKDTAWFAITKAADLETKDISLNEERYDQIIQIIKNPKQIYILR